MIYVNTVSDILQHERLSTSRWSDQQSTLSLSKRSEHVHHTSRNRPRPRFEVIPILRINWSLVFEPWNFGVIFRCNTIDVGNLSQPRPLLAPSRLDFARDHDTRTKPEFLDHGARNKRIRPFAIVVVFGTSQETVSVGMKLQQSYAFCQLCFINIGWIVVVLVVVIPVSAS